MKMKEFCTKCGNIRYLTQGLCIICDSVKRRDEPKKETKKSLCDECREKCKPDINPKVSKCTKCNPIATYEATVTLLDIAQIAYEPLDDITNDEAGYNLVSVWLDQLKYS